MAIVKRAATVILTAGIDGNDYLLLDADDVRWRISPDAKFGGIDVIRDDVATPLALENLKFCGGYIDEGETPESAILRELREEAGEKLSEAVAGSKLKTLYTMVRPLTCEPENDLELSYMHAHILFRSLADLHDMLHPNDDCLAIAIVKADQIVQTKAAYVVRERIPDDHVVFRKDYVPIPYDEWARNSGKPISEAARRAFQYYNDRGPTDRFVGIDVASLHNVGIRLYAPDGTPPAMELNAQHMISRQGGGVPNGAIYLQMVRPSLTPRLVSPSRFPCVRIRNEM